MTQKHLVWMAKQLFIETPINQHENPSQPLCSNSSVHFTCAHIDARTHPEHTWEAPWRLLRFQTGN